MIPKCDECKKKMKIVSAKANEPIYLRCSNRDCKKYKAPKRKIRSDKGKPRYTCSGYGWCEIHGEHGP